MKFSTSSALLLSFLLLASMMVEPVQSTEIRIRENKDKGYIIPPSMVSVFESIQKTHSALFNSKINSKIKQRDIPVRRTLKGKGGGNGGSPKGKGGNGGSGKGGSGKGGTCPNSNAESCVSDPGLLDTACKDSVNSDIDDTGACVGLDFIDSGTGANVGVCEDMEDVTVDKYSCVDVAACTYAAFAEICESSCQGVGTCLFANSLGDENHMLTIGPGSCRSGSFACFSVQNVEKIGSGSCIYDTACDGMNGSDDDRTTVGDNSCIGIGSCAAYDGTFIGDNACVGNGICDDCSLDVPDGKCNVDNGNTDCNTLNPATANCPCAC